MQAADYCLLIERLGQCEDLAEQARDPVVREKAAKLALGYRNLIASVERLSPSKWTIIRSKTIQSPSVVPSQEPRPPQ